MLAHNASRLGVPFDSIELFRGDPLYETQLNMVVEMVADTQRQQDEADAAAERARASRA